MCNRQSFHTQWNNHKGGHHHRYGGHRGRHGWKAHFQAAFNTPPANVLEKDDAYELQLFAPGFEKSDFIIGLTDDTLTISVKEQSEADANWKRKEYSPSGFKRQFALSDIVDKEAIEARYEQGVLIVTLPKLDGFETERQDIKVA